MKSGMCKGNESGKKKKKKEQKLAFLLWAAERHAKLLFVFIRKSKRINEQSYCINEPITGCREFLLQYAKKCGFIGIFFPPAFFYRETIKEKTDWSSDEPWSEALHYVHNRIQTLGTLIYI